MAYIVEKQGDYRDKGFLDSYRKITLTKGTKSTEEWQPWKQVSDRMGEDVLLEQIECGSAVARKRSNPRRI